MDSGGVAIAALLSVVQVGASEYFDRDAFLRQVREDFVSLEPLLEEGDAFEYDQAVLFSGYLNGTNEHLVVVRLTSDSTSVQNALRLRSDLTWENVGPLPLFAVLVLSPTDCIRDVSYDTPYLVRALSWTTGEVVDAEGRFVRDLELWWEDEGDPRSVVQVLGKPQGTSGDVYHGSDEPGVMSIATPAETERIQDRFVDNLVRQRVVRTPAVESALRRVRRHRFVKQRYRLEIAHPQPAWIPVPYDRDHPSSEDLAAIYSDRALVTAADGFHPTSSASQPSLVALMLELLDLRPNQQVLEIGTGTGCNAALLAEVLESQGCVFSMELRRETAAQAAGDLDGEGYGDVHIVCGDGGDGWADGAPYDRIEATIGCADIAQHGCTS